jgi:hypothetical protein
MLSHQAYKPVLFSFAKLDSNCKYEIFLPDIYPGVPLGSFCTVQDNPAMLQLMIVGDNVFQEFPHIRSAIDHVISQQMIDITNLRHEFDISFLAPRGVFSKKDVWAWLCHYLNGYRSPYSAVLHLGNQSILARYFSELIEPFIELTRRLELPIRDASAVGAWYVRVFRCVC